MRTIFIIAALFIAAIDGFAQNKSVVENDIKTTLEEFVSELSYLNDIDDPSSPEAIDKLFSGNHYFMANGSDTSMRLFLTNYRDEVLNGNEVLHEIDFSLNSISKTAHNNSDHRWNVSATLKRSVNNVDYLIKDTPIKFIVRWNGVDKRATLLEVNFAENLSIIKPVIKTEYVFEIDWNKTNHLVPHYGGDWKIAVKSQARTVKTYPGVSDKVEYSPYRFVEFDIDGYNYERTNNIVTGSFKSNPYHSEREAVYTFSQKGSQKVFSQKVIQSKMPKDVHKISPNMAFEANIIYSLKYNFGLSWMVKFENSRFAVGPLIAANNNFFKSTEGPSILSSESFIHVDLNTSKPQEPTYYKTHQEVITPSPSEYSPLMDPNNEAIHSTARTLFMLQGGYFLRNWCRFDLGIGIATRQELHFMETAYAVTKYSFEKMNQSLPDLDDVYSYKAHYKDYYYKDKEVSYFAIRPSANFRIPVTNDSWSQKFITLGLGYTYIPASSKASSIDFSIGFSWEM